jgi:flagellar motor switch protein FliG
MDRDRITGPQKAAILLFSLGEDLAAQIVKNLDEQELKKLGACMARVFSLSPESMGSVFSEFQKRASVDQVIPLDLGERNQFLRNVFSKAKEGSQTLLDEIQQTGKWTSFPKVRKLDAKTLANFIKNEHPQIIAVVLAHLDPGHTAAILEEFPAPLQTDVLYRIAKLENIPPGVLEEIEQTLQDEISLIENTGGKSVGGIRSAAEILNQMKGSAENQVLQAMEEQQQGLADEIRRWMFVFEDLIQVDDRSIMAILKEVETDALKMALRTASDELKEKIFKNMSERAATMMKEDLEVMGPVRLRDVETAQQTIIKVGKKLESEGKIVLSGKGKEDVLV